MSRRSWGGLLLLVAVMVMLFLLAEPIERVADRLLYAPWAYGDETLTGEWNGRLPDNTVVTLTLMREEEGGIPAPTDSEATVVGSVEVAEEVWQVNGHVNRSGSEIALVLWQGDGHKVGGFLSGGWSGAELSLDGEIMGQTIALRLTQMESER